MSNLARKIEKRNFLNVPIYTEAQMQAERKRIDDNYMEQYKDKLKRIEKLKTDEIIKNEHIVIDTISVELLYELALQMGAFNDDCEYIEEIRDKVQEIYSNTMKSIERYAKYKRPVREFNKRKNKVQKYFNIDFDK